MPSKKAKNNAIRKLIVFDYLSALIAWLLFWGYRHYLLGDLDFWTSWQIFGIRDYIMSLIVIPGGWLFLYMLSGTYFDLYRKSRLDEINRTLISCILGSIIVALTIFANDAEDYSYFIRTTGRYLFIHTAATLFLRLVLLNHIKNNLIYVGTSSTGFITSQPDNHKATGIKNNRILSLISTINLKHAR